MVKFRAEVRLVGRVSGYALGMLTGVTRRTRWPNLVKILEIFGPSKPTRLSPPLISYIPYAISHMAYPICHIPYAISHILYAISYIPYAISHMPYPICHILYAISHMPYPICHMPNAISHMAYDVPSAKSRR